MTVNPSLGPINSQTTFLPGQFELSKDEGRFLEEISQRERLTSSIVNLKVNGQYELIEKLTGEEWFSTQTANQPGRNVAPRYSYRVVVNFGALPNASTKAVAHGIPVNSNYIFTKIYATGTFANNTYIPIPYVNVSTPGDGVELFVDNTNVNIKTTTANWVNYNAYVVIEYIKG